MDDILQDQEWRRPCRGRESSRPQPQLHLLRHSPVQNEEKAGLQSGHTADMSSRASQYFGENAMKKCVNIMFAF